MSLVSFVKIETEGRIKEAIQDALELIQYKIPTNIKNIVIKPNMCYYWDYTTGQTTHPKFLAALVESITDQISSDLNISIIESDASAMKCKYVFTFLGYEKTIPSQFNLMKHLSPPCLSNRTEAPSVLGCN